MTSRFKLPTRQLRWLAVILPIAFWILVLAGQYLLFPAAWSWQLAVFELVAIALGATLFSFWIFMIVQEREAEIERRSQQLAALHDAAVALTTELELTTVLQKVVDLSRDLVGARYGALGVLQDDGRSIEQLIAQ